LDQQPPAQAGAVQAAPEVKQRKWRRWDHDEEKLLYKAVQQHGTKNWDLVAKEINTDRSARMLYERWNERNQEITARMEGRPPPPRTEKVRRKVRTNKSGASRSNKEGTGTHLDPPSTYFMLKSLHNRRETLEVGNQAWFAEAVGRYGRVAGFLKEVLCDGAHQDLKQEAEDQEAVRGRAVLLASEAWMGAALHASECMGTGVALPVEPTVPQEVWPIPASDSAGLGVLRAVTDSARVGEAARWAAKAVPKECVAQL